MYEMLLSHHVVMIIKTPEISLHNKVRSSTWADPMLNARGSHNLWPEATCVCLVRREP